MPLPTFQTGQVIPREAAARTTAPLYAGSRRRVCVVLARVYRCGTAHDDLLIERDERALTKETNMSFTAVEIPEQTRARKPRISDAEVREIVKMLKAGKTPSDGELYLAKGKGTAKTRAYAAGYLIRTEVAARSDLSHKSLSVRTWADGEGFRWALATKGGRA